MPEEQKLLIDLDELRKVMLNEGSPIGARICKEAHDYISNRVKPQVTPKIAELEKENKRLRKALEKIHNDIGVCGNDSIGKWGVEEYCRNILGYSNSK